MKVKYILAAVGIAVVAPLAIGAYNTFVNVATAPSRVIGRTLNTDNIIQQYEKFHDRCAAIQAYEVSLQAQEDTLAAIDPDSKEATRVRSNIAGLRAQRQRAISQYNVDANKTNVGIFQGRTLPRRIDPNGTTVCE